MTEPAQPHPVERLFPFVLKTRALLVGRDTLRANKGKLHFVLITEDIAESSREEVLKDFSHYPVVQFFTAADFEKFFAVKGAKAVGFTKSGLAQSIYAELKAHRLNKPPVQPTPPKFSKPAPVEPKSE
ncbi:MAG TPA: hypothetical protein VGI63_06240 [Verrucomicrobiae bacterium]|jgi:hypothetical protein